MKKLIFFLFNLLIAGILSAQTLPPLPATSGSSSAGHDPECALKPPIVDDRSINVRINNNHQGSPLRIADVEIVTIDLMQNSITSIQVDNNGFASGYPQWNMGIHEIDIFFSNKVRSTRPDKTFILSVTIKYMTNRDNQIHTYAKELCVKDPTPTRPRGGRKYANQDYSSEFKLPIEKQGLDTYILDSFDPSLFINVKDTEVPVSVYVIGLSNPNYMNTIRREQYLPFGENTIRLEELPTGIYQVVVQQGAKISRLKFVSVD